MSRPWRSTSCWQICSASFSRPRFSRTCFSSLSVARRTTGRRGCTTALSSTMELRRTQVPYSRPLPVSTMTLRPSGTVRPAGSK